MKKVAGEGVEPSCLSAQHFECCVSAIPPTSQRMLFFRDPVQGIALVRVKFSGFKEGADLLENFLLSLRLHIEATTTISLDVYHGCVHFFPPCPVVVL